MARIAIIVGHSRTGTFCEALGEAYRKGAAAGGHHADLFVTARMSFDPILREGYERIQPLEPDLQTAHDAIMAADHMILIFPLWLGGMPAIMKGFLERVLQPEIQPSGKAGRFATPLKGKSAHILVPMGMPGFVYRWWFGPSEIKILKHNILGFIGAAPVRSTIFGNIEGVGAEGRARWLRETEDLGRRAG